MHGKYTKLLTTMMIDIVYRKALAVLRRSEISKRHAASELKLIHNNNDGSLYDFVNGEVLLYSNQIQDQLPSVDQLPLDDQMTIRTRYIPKESYLVS